MKDWDGAVQVGERRKFLCGSTVVEGTVNAFTGPILHLDDVTIWVKGLYRTRAESAMLEQTKIDCCFSPEGDMETGKIPGRNPMHSGKRM